MRLLRQRQRLYTDSSDLTAARLRPEDELLLCSARVRQNAAAAERMRSLLRREIDWSSLMPAARRHGLMPLLYWHLHSVCSDLVPAPVLHELRNRFVNNSARNLLLTTELVRILTLFDDHGIAALPFKGPVLGESIYGNLAFRQFEDLDILVPEQEIAEAEALLRAQGYKATLEVPQGRSAAFRRMQYEIPYRHEATSICIELHWKMAPIFFQFAMDMESVWKRVEWISLAGSRIRNLSSEDTLLILCAHGSRHFWEKLEWICGVAELIRAKPQIDWAWILGHARDHNSERVLLFGLLMAHDLLGAELPEGVRHRIRKNGRLLRLGAEARSRLFASDRQPITAVEHSLHQMRLTDRWRDALRMLLRTLFLPRYHDWIYVELPTCLSFLYYPLRIFRLLRKCVP